MARIEEDATLQGRYRLIRPSRMGAAGEVWEASDELFLNGAVDVEILRDDPAADPMADERRRQGIESIRWPWFYHSSAPRVLQYGRDGLTQFVVLEHVEGETLAERLARLGPLQPTEAALVAADIGEVIQKAHDAGFVHGDLRAANVLVTANASVKVLDLGLSRTAWESLASPTAVSIEVARKPRSRRQRAPKPEVSKEALRADLYALGTLLYEMLTGQPAAGPGVEGEEEGTHVPLDVQAPSIPSELATICERTISARLAERPPNAASFAAALRQAVAHPSPSSDEPAGLDGPEVERPERRVIDSSDASASLPRIAQQAARKARDRDIRRWRAAEHELARQETDWLAAAETARQLEAEWHAAEEAARRLESDWLAAEETARMDAKRLAAEGAAGLEAARQEADRLQAARLEAEEAARLEAKLLEAARLEAARREGQRLQTERLVAEETARLDAQRLEAEEAARLEAARQEAAAREAQRLEAERVEAERLAAEEAARRETRRLEAARKEAERLQAERQEAERLAADEAAHLEASRQETARREAERRENERLVAEETARLDAQRLEAEEAARLEAARQEAAAREAQRLEAERVEAERLAAEEAARRETRRLEAARKEAERLQAERQEAERLAAEEAARLEVTRLAAERLAAERLVAERLVAEEAARLEAERLATERLAAERLVAKTRAKLDIGSLAAQMRAEPEVDHREIDLPAGDQTAGQVHEVVVHAEEPVHEEEPVQAVAEDLSAEGERDQAGRDDNLTQTTERAIADVVEPKIAPRSQKEFERMAKALAKADRKAKRKLRHEGTRQSTMESQKEFEHKAKAIAKADRKATRGTRRLVAKQNKAVLKRIEREAKAAAKAGRTAKRAPGWGTAPSDTEGQPQGDSESDGRVDEEARAPVASDLSADRPLIATQEDVGGTKDEADEATRGAAGPEIDPQLKVTGGSEARGRGVFKGILAMVVALAVGTTALLFATHRSRSPSGQAGVLSSSPPVQSSASPVTVAIPQVAGSTVNRARIKLFDAGLTFARAVPTSGPPGLVVRTDPAVGANVPVGTSVTLYVGVSADRSGG